MNVRFHLCFPERVPQSSEFEKKLLRMPSLQRLTKLGHSLKVLTSSAEEELVSLC